MSRLRHFDHLGTARFVTFSCYHRFRLLQNPIVIRCFLTELGHMRDRGIKVLGYVVMPEHVHLVLLPPDGLALGREIGRLKSLSARAMLPILEDTPGTRVDLLRVERDGKSQSVFWQRRCYDHNCRRRETVREKIVYCHNNAVKRGLVNNSADWPWSSYRWYNRLDGVELEIDPFES